MIGEFWNNDEFDLDLFYRLRGCRKESVYSRRKIEEISKMPTNAILFWCNMHLKKDKTK